ncbi:TPA: hypothetical protein ACKP4S_003514 [Stenotrophomonas maltophilia]|uniref:hypothetical protein n=1 Tax=Stenotrophomonas sp. SMYL86 TaxID=3076044 RepID=UPI002E78A0EF|nr:hypothetical protein [Stenotrophomonas sp. SMYL86]
MQTLRVQALIVGPEHRSQPSIGDIVSIKSNDVLRSAVTPISRPANAREATAPRQKGKPPLAPAPPMYFDQHLLHLTHAVRICIHPELEKARAARTGCQALANSPPVVGHAPRA